VRDRIQVVRDNSGRPLRLDGCLADITEQWQARRRSGGARSGSGRWSRRAARGFCCSTPAGLIRYASPAVRVISGSTRPALSARPGWTLVHPDDRPAVARVLAQVLANPGESVPWTGRWVTDGGRVQVVETSECNRLDDPSVRAVVVNYRDVTERERAVEAMARQHALLGGLFASLRA